MPTSGCRRRWMTPAGNASGSISDPRVTGAIPIKVIGKIGENDSRVGIEADLTSLRLDNILPGWVKVPGKSGASDVRRGEEGTIDAVPGHRGRRRRRFDQGIAGSRPEWRPVERELPDLRPSDGDKTSLKAERGADGVVKVTDARRRVRRPRIPQVGDNRQGSRSQEQVQEHRPRHRPQARRGAGIQRRSDAQRR